MTRLLPLSLLALGGLIGCARHAQPNSDCEWPHEIASGPLNLSQQSQLHHLSDDAEFAEDLGIRYADMRRGPHSGHFEGMPKYGRTRDQCITALFKVIGSSHGVSEEQVRRSLGHRRTSIDLAVMVSFVLLFGFGASLVTRRVVRSYPAEDGWTAPVVMTALVAIAGSVFGVLDGELWSLMLEDLRVGSGHLSYRVERIPWTQHRIGLFLGGAVLIVLISGFQYYRAPVRGTDSRMH
jgi:hypothetical protein